MIVYITSRYVTLRAGVECQDTERGYRCGWCASHYITSHYVQVWSVRTQREAIAVGGVHYVTLGAGVECQDTERGQRCGWCALPYITSHHVQVWSVRTQTEAIAAVHAPPD